MAPRTKGRMYSYTTAVSTNKHAKITFIDDKNTLEMKLFVLIAAQLQIPVILNYTLQSNFWYILNKTWLKEKKLLCTE